MEEGRGGDIVTSRARLAAAFSHRETDRVPLDLGTGNSLIARRTSTELSELLGGEAASLHGPGGEADLVAPRDDILEILGIDVRLVDVPCRRRPVTRYLGTDMQHERVIREETTAEGKRRRTYEDGRIVQASADGGAEQLVMAAITEDLTPEAIDRVYPPGSRYPDWADRDASEAAVSAVHARGLAAQASCFIMPVTITTTGPLSWQSWCTEFALEPTLVCRLMDAYLEHAFAYAESFYAAIGAFADVVLAVGDDMATQTGMWMSPADYRKHIKPRHARVIEFVKRRTQARIVFHCCGACRPIIGDFIDIGVDALIPTQTRSSDMDPVQLKKDFGADITFWGGIDVTEVLPKGSEADVEREVKRHIDALAPGGGYVLGPSHVIQADVPARNVAAMYRTALRYGANR